MAMSLGEARAVVANMKQKYMAFDRAEEALELAAQSEQYVSELNLRRSKLDEILSAKTAEIASLENTKKEVQDQIARERERAAKVKKDIEAAIVEHKNALIKYKEETDKAKLELKKQLNDAEKEHKEAIAKMKANQEEEKARIAELQNVFANLKKTAASL